MATMGGVFIAGTITVAASGTELIYPVKSNEPFKNLSLTVKPVELSARYTVTVLFDGEVAEQHSFPTGSKMICHMNFPLQIFPPNVGTDVIPAFFNASQMDPQGISIAIQIRNQESTQQVFLVYACFEEFDTCRFKHIVQET